MARYPDTVPQTSEAEAEQYWADSGMAAGQDCTTCNFNFYLANNPQLVNTDGSVYSISMRLLITLVRGMTLV